MAPPSPEHKEAFSDFLSAYGKSRLVVTSHRKTDVDGLASAYAMHRILPGSIIATDELDENAKALVERLNIEVRPIRELDRKDYAGLVVVDTAAYTLLEPAKEWKILLVIDHHHPQGRDMESDVFIVDDKSPSTAEIIAGLLPGMDSETAFALACAVISDTARFKSGRVETFETLARLMRICGATYHELLEIAEPEARPDVKMAILKACQRVNVVYSGGLVIATSEVSSNESDAAQVLSEAADVAFVASWKDRERETRISARARKSVSIELNEVMKDVGISLGGNGGGHPKAAGATVKVHTKEALDRCLEALMARLENPGCASEQ
jgi:nanoRNase/pAp phosphatase (c-di-AMP/oligoRNAs hydrolase)